MKKLLFFYMTILLTGCNEEKVAQNINYQIVEGSYQGYFTYQGTNYWCSIELKNGNYDEGISGGVFYQKSPGCLSVGEYSINGARIFFNLDSLKMPGLPNDCISNMKLPGVYDIVDYINQDSLIFKRGQLYETIVYSLRLK